VYPIIGRGLALSRNGESERASARERLLRAAYELFAAHGIAQVGIDAILAKSHCAKSSLYANFESKSDLAIAFLDRREELWTRNWLEAEVKGQKLPPDERLLCVFDVFDRWFRKNSFEGCSFINVLLESVPDSPVHRSAITHLAKIRAIIRELADDANLAEPTTFAQVFHMLMKGSIIAAHEGNRNAAREAKVAAKLFLAGWGRRQSSGSR
jgi:AcrR family transcriptional regulator